MRVLEAVNIWKRYTEKGEWILSGLEITLGEGEILAVIGGNGTGKTTLLKIISGLIPPSKGNVRVLGREPRERQARKKIGLVLHASLAYDELTVSENLRYYASLYGVEDYDPSEDETVRRLGLKDKLGQTAKELSFGWRKRVDIARALIHRPALLLFDEPFTGLDGDGVRELASIIEEESSRGAAVVVTAPKKEDLQILDSGNTIWTILRGGRLHEI